MKLVFSLFVLFTLTNVWAQETKNSPKTLSKQIKDDCICTMIYMPVCVDGKTYASPCAAKCAGHSKWEDGACAEKAPKAVMTPPPEQK